jgi:hypothetical protein
MGKKFLDISLDTGTGVEEEGEIVGCGDDLWGLGVG